MAFPWSIDVIKVVIGAGADAEDDLMFFIDDIH
jgi:hypothetical protein